MTTPLSPHDEAARRLTALDQRYTRSRRALVEALAAAGRPLTIVEVLGSAPSMPMSSAYRNMTVLIEAAVVRRVTGTDDHGRFELTEDLSEHHHHLVCDRCGKVADITASLPLERALSEAARLAAKESGYRVDQHRFDFLGTCPDCT